MEYTQKGTSQFLQINIALFIAGFVTFANLYITQPLMPIFSKEFHLTPSEASLSLSISTITLAIGLIFTGAISEKVGRKKMMVLSIIVSSVLTIICTFAPSFHALLIIRAIQGLATAGIPAIAMAYLGEEVHPSQLGVAMGLYISGNSIGGLAGRIVIAGFTDLWGWRWAMIILGAFSLLLSLYFIVALPKSKNFQSQNMNIHSLIGTLINHMKNPNLLKMYLVGFLLMSSFVTLFNYISYHLKEAPYFLSASLVGWIFIVYLVGTISSTWFGSLADRFGKSRILLLGIFIMLTGSIVTVSIPLVVKILGIVIFTFGFFGSHSIASSIVSANASSNKAQASSLYLFLYYVGSSIGGTVGGYFWIHDGWTGVVLFIALMLCLSILIALRYTFIVRKNLRNS